MKTCKGREAEMAAEAENCPQCGAEMAAEATDWSYSGLTTPRGAWKTYALILAVLAILAVAGLTMVHPLITSTCSPWCAVARTCSPSCAQVAAVATQIAGATTSGVRYDKCGGIGYSSGMGGNELDEPPSAAQQSETCLWQHYQRGRRAMLLVQSMGESDAPNVTALFTIDPADHGIFGLFAAPIRVETMGFYINGDASASTATCRALLSTPSGLQVDGCSPNSAIDPNQALQEVQGAIQSAEADQTATARPTAAAQ